MNREPIFDVYFPSRWSGVSTALWCVRRQIGFHFVYVDDKNAFTRISVVTIGTIFEPFAVYDI